MIWGRVEAVEEGEGEGWEEGKRRMCGEERRLGKVGKTGGEHGEGRETFPVSLSVSVSLRWSPYPSQTL